MKKKIKILLTVILIILLGISSIWFISLKSKGDNNQHKDIIDLGDNNQGKNIVDIGENEQEQEDLINIAECSEEFMENYFEESKEIQEKNNKDNILIVTSKEKIQNTYGATDIIEAPNNQYLLQYNTEEEKNKALKELNELEEIVVEENKIRTITGYNSWGVEKIGLDYAVEIANEKNLNDVTVAIVDSGCDMELFNKNYQGKIVEKYNVLDPESDIMTDEKGHGTHIAGTIAEATPDNVKILPIKITSDGGIYSTDIIAAINYITYYDKADVINMSFGGYERSESEYQAIEAANQKNIISIASAGNDNTNREHYPSSYDNTISISAVDSKFNKSDFSNYSSTVTFAAPGTDILSINGTMSGTSMANPHAASAVAILKSYNKSIDINDTIELLKRCAIDLGEEGHDEYYGYGCINFKGTEFYDGNNGDEYNVFKDDGINTLPIIKIESEETFSTKYNYGNITNIMDANIKFYYNENEYYTKKLGELNNFEISGYEPYNYTVQTVTILYNNIEMSLEVDNSGATKKGWEYEINEDNTIKITKINKDYGTSGPLKIYIPESIDGYVITDLGDNLFEAYTEVNLIVMPESIKTIGEETFYNCNNLKEANLPNNLIKIGRTAFFRCHELKEVNLPNSLIELGQEAFSSCKSLKEISIPNNITTIKLYTFSGCSDLSEVELPNRLTDIEGGAFEDCVSLKNIQFPESLKTMGFAAFRGCNSLQKIVIPENLVSIDNAAFRNCSGLEEIIVDEQNTIYDSRENCNALIETQSNTLIIGSANTEIPSTVKSIEFEAFFNNNKLAKLIIHEGVEEIRGMAFGNCTNLKNIIIPKSVENMAWGVFVNCNDTITVWVHKDSYAETYAKEQGLNYRVIEVNVPIDKTQYKAFESIDNLEIIVNYDDGTQEIIKDGINIKYADKNTSFRVGDTYFTISGYNKMGLFIEKRIEVTVTKAMPEYTIPTNIIGHEKQQLSEIQLPEGFEWMDNTQIIEGLGNKKYKAKYTPKDTTNYEIVENIEIILNVKDEIKAQSIILDKTNLIFNHLEKQKITATIMPENAYNKNVIWKSTNTNVAVVNQLGEVQPIKDGKCEIICVAETNPENVKAKCTVVVDNSLQATISKTYNNDNTVTVKVVSKYPFKETKPTWTLSKDKKTYTKTYNTNGTYSTIFEDTYNHSKSLTFTINEIKSKYNVIKTHDKNTNKVTVSVINNFGMQQTKPTWKLSLDQKTYTKVYNANGTYTTTFVDSKGIATPITFTVNEIDTQAPIVTVTKNYNSNTNTVTVKVTSNEIFGKTKPTWTLSNDKKIYTKEYNTNGTYTTVFKDVYGNEKNLTFTVNEIKSKYSVIKTHDKNTNKVTVSVINNFGMQQTKPTWNLSSDAKTYTKIYSLNGTYTTNFVNAKGTVTPITFTIDELDNKAPKLSIIMNYNSDINTVTVKVTSDEILGETKPTWTLSKDKKTYTKEYKINGTYTTVFKDIYGNETNLTFIVSHIESKYKIIKTYNKATKRVTVSVINNFRMQQTKPTWKLSEDSTTYTKEYSSNGTYTTTFVDMNGESKKLTFTINEI